MALPGLHVSKSALQEHPPPRDLREWLALGELHAQNHDTGGLEEIRGGDREERPRRLYDRSYDMIDSRFAKERSFCGSIEVLLQIIGLSFT
jgi:hypothetical protein